MEAITLLVALLGHHDYRIREAALDKAPPIVLALAQNSADPEVAWRASQRLKQVGILQKELDHWVSLAWIDALPLDYPNRQEVIRRYVALAEHQGVNYGEAWDNYKKAMQLFLLTLPPDEAMHLIRVVPRGMWWQGSAWVSVCLTEDGCTSVTLDQEFWPKFK